MLALNIALLTLSVLQSAVATPTGLIVREDWKIALGWDGKITTAAELDPSNATKALEVICSFICGRFSQLNNLRFQKRLTGGVYFCTDANYGGNCVSVVLVYFSSVN